MVRTHWSAAAAAAEAHDDDDDEVEFLAVPTDDRSDVIEMTADIVFKKLSPLFVGATNDWN